MTPEMLRELHRSRTEAVRRTILEDGFVHPWMDFICPREGLEAKVEAIGLCVMPVWQNQPDAEWAVCTMSGAYHPTQLVDLYQRVGCKPEHRAILQTMRDAGPKHFGIHDKEQVDRSILAALCGAMKCEDKDILAANIKGAIRELGAYAFIKADEAWTLTGEGLSEEEFEKLREESKDLSKHRLRREVLFVSLEWRRGFVMSTSPIIRERPGDVASKVIDVGRAVFNENLEVTGRYTGFFRDVH